MLKLPPTAALMNAVWSSCFSVASMPALASCSLMSWASALFAGVSRVPLPAYLAVTTLANLGISAVYAAVGARAYERGSFLLAFAASVALPGAAMALHRLVGRRR